MNKRDNQLSNIQRFAAAVDSGKYRTEKEITSAIKCAAGIGTAFKNLGLLRKGYDSNLCRNWRKDMLPVAEIQSEYYRLRKETTDKAKQKAQPKAPLLPDTPEGLNIESRSFVDAAKSAGISPQVHIVEFRFCDKEPISLANAIACIFAAVEASEVFGDKTKKP